MKTSDLIRMLAGELTPVSPRKTQNDLVVGIGSGAAVTLLAVLLAFGVQPGLITASHGMPLVMKAAYALTLAAIASSMLLPMLRPGSPVPMRLSWLAAAIFVLTCLALLQTVVGPQVDRESLWMGASWRLCSLRIVFLSAPIFVGACWAMRRQAPVNLRAAGALAGLIAGGITASLYALACPENGAGFVLIWYTLGIAISTAIGGLIGTRVLRW